MLNKISIISILIILIGCKEHHTPLPKGYFRIDLPENKYRNLNIKCPFNFKYSEIAIIVDDKDFCWFNIEYPSLNAKIHCTYKPINSNLNLIIEDSRDFVYNHISTATAIKETSYTNNFLNSGGILYKLNGNTASPIQFFITDSIKHFLRGGLYFFNEPNADSLKPVIEYLEKDIKELMNSLTWKESI